MKHYIQPFTEACTQVFKNFLGIEITPESPYFFNKAISSEWDISGVIGLTGDIRGTVVISMKKELAIKLTEKITGQTYTHLDDEVIDAIGEIVNIISGNAKRGFESTFHLVLSVPTIIRGKEHSIAWPGYQATIICVPFKLFKDEVFTLSVTIEQSHKD